MKILHIIDSGGLYGAEVMLLNLIEEQRRMGLEPILASIGDPGISQKPLEAETEKRGLRVEAFRMLPGPNIAGALKILRFAKEEKVDILHSHGYKGNILFGLMPRSLRRIPMVTTLHGWTWTGGWSRMALYEWLDRLSLRFIDRVVVVSEAMRAKVGIKNVYVVNNGIPIDSTNQTYSIDSTDSMDTKDPIVSFCNGGYTIGSIGRLSPEKGHGILLRAIKEASESVPEIRLVILGEGVERGSLEAEVKRLGLEAKVLLPGYVANASRYLPLFKIFVLPSLTEGLPMVILEAMRAGVPIIATRVGGIPEVLDDGKAGALVAPYASSDIANKLISTMGKQVLRNNLIENGKLVLANNFSSIQMYTKYMQIYSDLLSSNPRNHSC